MIQELSEQINHQNSRITKIEKLLDKTLHATIAPKEEALSSQCASKPSQSMMNTNPVQPAYKPIETKPINWQTIELTIGKYGLQIVCVIKTGQSFSPQIRPKNGYNDSRNLLCTH